MEKMSKDGIKVHEAYWKFGRYETVFIFEAPDEKTAMKATLLMIDMVKSETIVVTPRKEALKPLY
jgi:uncharacterized protein with GYD domain